MPATSPREVANGNANARPVRPDRLSRDVPHCYWRGLSQGSRCYRAAQPWERACHRSAPR